MNEPSGTELTHGNLNRAIRILAVPMVLEMSMESVFAVADVFFVSRISTDAVAVVGLTEAFLYLVYAISFGLAIGTTALVARRIGEQKPAIAARAAVQANWLGLAVSLPITLIGIVSAEKLLIAMGASAELASFGSVYLAISLGGNAVIMLLFINNAVYGMTGGQMAPTTLPQQKTTTSPNGRSANDTGKPIRMCEMLSTLEGTIYATRVTMTDSRSIVRAKRSIKRALEIQIENNRTGGKGTCLVEVLIGCPTNWKMTPQQANQFVSEEMTEHFPLGVFREPGNTGDQDGSN